MKNESHTAIKAKRGRAKDNRQLRDNDCAHRLVSS